ncbi:MAG: NUDIX domain-containing protein [Anaerolineales bacterium]|nr:NUDIX domain-containing protein [Anaerolineales bacterium]
MADSGEGRRRRTAWERRSAGIGRFIKDDIGGQQIHPRPYAVIFNEQLRLHRDQALWQLPGGGVEQGKLPTETVVRETKEDTSLNGSRANHRDPRQSQRKRSGLPLSLSCGWRSAGSQTETSTGESRQKLSRKSCAHAHSKGASGCIIHRWRTQAGLPWRHFLSARFAA